MPPLVVLRRRDDSVGLVVVIARVDLAPSNGVKLLGACWVGAESVEVVADCRCGRRAVSVVTRPAERAILVGVNRNAQPPRWERSGTVAVGTRAVKGEGLPKEPDGVVDSGFSDTSLQAHSRVAISAHIRGAAVGHGGECTGGNESRSRCRAKGRTELCARCRQRVKYDLHNQWSCLSPYGLALAGSSPSGGWVASDGRWRYQHQSLGRTTSGDPPPATSLPC